MYKKIYRTHRERIGLKVTAMKKYLRWRESNEFVNKMCHRLKLNTQIDHEAIMAALDLRIEAPRDTIDRRQMFDVQS